MSDLWITNPLTNRKIKKDGRVYKSLVRANIIKTEFIEEKKEIVEHVQQNRTPKYELIDLAKIGNDIKFIEKSDDKSF